jgi:DNA (cytosine-5)-methyltransferase 1
MSSQQQTSTTPADARDEWRTPPFVFDFWARRFRFDVDLAATPENALCAYYVMQENDALSYDWAGIWKCGWLNPPYSNLEPWLEKARAEAARGFTTVALLPVANGQLFYGRQLFGVASEVWFISGRLAFLDSAGKPRAGNTAGSLVAVYRAYDLGDTRYGHIWRHHMEADYRAAQAEREAAA